MAVEMKLLDVVDAMAGETKLLDAIDLQWDVQGIKLGCDGSVFWWKLLNSCAQIVAHLSPIGSPSFWWCLE